MNQLTFGDTFATIAVREPQPRASEAFTVFGDLHRQMEKKGIAMLKQLKPILADLGTFLHKAIPDTRLTIRKYADAKFEYLSYCLKVKEMDDEEHSYASLQEPLYRVETGNYEYRQFGRSSLTLKDEKTSVIRTDNFGKAQQKSKETFLEAIGRFHYKDVHKRGHVEFIYSALKHMKDFGVHRDLEAYKKILDVFPKGQFIPTNMLQVEFQHYPKHQQCAVDLLEQMEDCGVMPDVEMEDMIRNIFGKHSFPLRKYGRMMYWMPKFKNISPWPVPHDLNDSLELAKLAIQRISSVDLQSKMEIFQASELPDALDHTWIVSAQSPTQRQLIESYPADKAVYVEGAFTIWLRRSSVSYFILRGEPSPPPTPTSQTSFDPDDVSQLRSWILGEEPQPEKDILPTLSVHEQDDGIILGVAATGTSSRDSVLSWVRFLERQNPRLGSLPVIFTSQSPLGPVIPALELVSNPLLSAAPSTPNQSTPAMPSKDS
nr:EOG090X07J4 [Lepidurus arcticus]